MIRFKANGKEFELPDTATFTLDEAMIMYDYSGLTLDQVSEIEGLHPGVIAALVHVGVARDNPDLKRKQIETEVRRLNIAELMGSLEDDETEAEPEDLGGAASSGSSATASGDDSETSSDSREPTNLAHIGTPASASAESHPQRSAG